VLSCLCAHTRSFSRLRCLVGCYKPTRWTHSFRQIAWRNTAFLYRKVLTESYDVGALDRAYFLRSVWNRTQQQRKSQNERDLLFANIQCNNARCGMPSKCSAQASIVHCPAKNMEWCGRRARWSCSVLFKCHLMRTLENYSTFEVHSA
jgi:hypothetical protein